MTDVTVKRTDFKQAAYYAAKRYKGSLDMIENAMTDYNDGNWHGWNGGECPVHPKSVVALKWITRDLVPALLAERDALKSEVERLKEERDEAMEGWHVIHPNITVQDAMQVPEIKALIESATIVDDSYWNSTDGVIRGIYDLGVALHNITEGRE